MSVPTIISMAGSIVGIAGFIWALIRWLHRSVVNPVLVQVDEKIAPIMAELSHNGGTSLKDQVVDTRRELREYQKATGERFDRVDARIDGLYVGRRK